MPMRFSSEQVVRTKGNDALAGASAASAALWLRLDGEANLERAWFVFGGQDNTGLGVRLAPGVGRLKVRWQAQGGEEDTDLWLTPGRDHHLAMTFEDGDQRFYLDGQLVATAAV